MKKNISLLIFISIVLSNNLHAQKAPDLTLLKPWELKSFAKNAIRVGDIYSAANYYEAYLVLVPESFRIRFKLANMYRMARDYQKAEENYHKCYADDSIRWVKGIYYEAMMQKMNGKYDAAKKNFQKFIKYGRNSDEDKLFKKLAKIEIAGCDAEKALKDDPKYIVTHLDSSINKAHIEFAPLPLSDSTLLYASLVADSLQYFPVSNDSVKKPVRQFYMAKRKVETKWKGGYKSPLPFNYDGVNTGNGAYSPDKKKFFFTKCAPNYENKIICAIYESKYDSGRWSEPVKLDKRINNPNYTSTQPTVGIESKNKSEVLYFVSDRKKGRGGLDIWYSIYDPRIHEFREPRNAGAKLNTAGDEVTPTYDIESHSMYFSSNGYPGLGGLDVFKTTGEMKQWTPVVNVGFPVNSSADDAYFIKGINKEEGFFASNRTGSVSLRSPTCCDDIYTFKYKQYIHVAIRGTLFEIMDTSNLKFFDKMHTKYESLNDSLLGTTFDKIGKDGKTKQLPVTPISLYMVDKEGKEIFIKTDSSNKGGKYFFNLEQGNDYKMVAGSSDFFTKKVSFTTKNIVKSDTIEKHIGIRRIPKQPIIVKNIYYDFDKYFLRPEAMKTIDTTMLSILTENPDIIVEISSHTDSKGKDDYNIKLSQHRAESVVNYLIGKGISQERLVAKGYGKTKPIAPNTKADGSDDPDGRQMNRRTEFRVIGVLDKYSRIIYED